MPFIIMENQTEPKSELEVKTEEADKKELSLIDQATEAAQTLKEQIGLLRIENDRMEQLRAATILGGKGDTGQQAPQKQKLSDVEFSQKAMKGELTKDDLE